MLDLDEAKLTQEMITLLENTQTMILATCSNNKVTARSMAVVNDGLTVLFQTGGHSEKIRQLTQNRNVALAAGHMQVEATAQVTEDPGKIQGFLAKYREKYPQYYAAYSGMLGEVTVVCTPVRVAIYRFIDGRPCTDVLDVTQKRAYREVLM
ncbi:MAG: pyridoxamine 5'-phosphate oxidase family protein [Oscillospiraceae bacterium]|nr:pyridoxamine 5'-phosphate oxidase family protein [Oscillospiraceae bacterium]